MKLDKIEVYTNSKGETSTKAILTREEEVEQDDRPLWVVLSFILTLCGVAIAMLWIGMSL